MSSSTSASTTMSSPDSPTTTTTTTTSSSPSSSSSPIPNFNGNLQLDDQVARQFSQNIGKVVNLSHLVPALSGGACQKFQLEQAAAAVSFERLSPAEREAAKESHFIEGLKRGYDFCFATAKCALNEALTRGVPPSSPTSSSKSDSSSHSGSSPSPTKREDSVKSATSSSSVLLEQKDFPTMKSFNSCEDITAATSSGKKGPEAINEHIIQCIAELSYYSIEVLQQVFLVSKNPKIQVYMRNYAVKSTNQINNATITTITDNNNNNNDDITDNNTASSSTTSNKLMEYIRSSFATSREIELAWFAEGFRTSHMNLLCNSLFECPAACRAVLDCEGLIMLILFHGKHLDPENPGLNEWSAFAMRTITKEVPEAGARISEMKRKAQQMSAEKRKEQDQSEEQMRDHMRKKQQEFM